MKKRYIVLAVLVLEIFMLLSVGQRVQKSDLKLDMSLFSKPQRAVNVKLGAEPGVTRYMVYANAPFAVTSKDIIGQFDVAIYASGKVNDKPFGENAKQPGPKAACSLTKTTDEHVIYRSETGTIAGDGEILSKTVLVEIRYEPYYKPDVKILTQKKSEDIHSAQSCLKSALTAT